MNRLGKLGLVIGGYVAACLIAGIAVYMNQIFTQSAAAQASSGMHAFNDFLIFVGMFGICALFPTGLALFFLLRNFWKR